ncbi:MAG: hypothetical protein CO030_02025 [Candidatus Magasanikbacteria bacterium CG_4_9_14_0_2_um_filter_42_11]|uniref:PKD domain-containing protein n=1 Tax=Candidatus Magasanikbacteria bacterium CG_4_9_14_0_2_um_filter_42_11 TaxID=1974643 RepID=A0A2M8FA36_9BACT|nr:MAG: hypothetical protein COU34_02945 [Candidatus Magasanikbacteria bacterium CG10_big_fil_rev_8_21_14_0_10_43_9]PIY92998.1 MAG: hypothetical protein COY70_00325 [Candidatus Magasanikbacteria bacterium CG_4_10_14_0_8_um_filter_42_12]PJC52600.1 MAG: hypothetical protein CO030_02025 [Candidatus Magasanikbacteria bacterium CG_4_9_14_0_2_um_filter_42_11]
MKQDIYLFIFTLILLGSVFLFSAQAKSDAPSIVITEIGAYESSGVEWIELFNAGDSDIDLTGWKFVEANTNHSLSLAQGDDATLGQNEYAIIAQNDEQFRTKYPNVTAIIFDSSWSTLNESGEELALKNSDGDIVEQFTYIASSDFSLERIDPLSQNYTDANWKEHPNENTAGVQNYWHVGAEHDEPINQAPTAIFSVSSSTIFVHATITFDASNSIDDVGIASYSWNFGDGDTATTVTTTHEYNAIGNYDVMLTVKDTDDVEDTHTQTISVVEQTEEDEKPIDTSTTNYNIRINEFVSNPNTDEHEWIELFNFSTSSIVLTGWTLHDGAGQIAAPTSTIEANNFAVVELNSSKLNNGGDKITLNNTNDETINAIAYGDWEDATITAPGKGNAMAIGDDDVWHETTSSTKGSENIITAPVEEIDDTPAPSSGGGGGGSVTPSYQMYDEGVVVINELVSDPQDGENEFVELFNTSNTSISLDNWWIEDGSEAKTMLEGSIAAHGFIVIDTPKGNLNNSGDIVLLFDPSGKNIDKVTYGTWDDGDTSDNAPAPPDPLSIARRSDGLDADNDFYDFILTDTITKGKPNIISLTTTDESGTGQVLGTKIFASDVRITEIYPNPPGSDSEDECIELYNTSDKTVDITGWKLGDSSKKRYTLTDGHMTPGAYLVLKRATTGIALNNSGGEEVGLYDPNGAMVEKAQYAGSAPEGQSWARKEDGSWAWTTEVTPSEANVIEGKSAAPIIAIAVDTEVTVDEHVLFDASDTTDPESEDMIFVWSFGDNSTDEGDVITHAFGEEGTYTVTLAVTDASGNTSSKDVIIMVKNRLSFVGGFNAETPIEKIEISEILPNPKGSDTTEFIELYNPTDEVIDLTDMKLDDEEGGSRAYTIPQETTIAPRQYLVFGRQDTKLALNNTTDNARILYPDGTVLREVRYDDVLEGHSYVKDENDEWIWTSTLTPGKATILSPPDDSKASKTITKSKMVKPIINTTLAMLRSEDVGDTVTLSGTVAVEPGIFGTQYFYIVDPMQGNQTATTTEQTDESQDILAENATPGAQVYMFSKDFPKMDIGDIVQVTGEISESGGETRIKLKEKADITVLEHSALPTGVATDIADIGEEREGWLVELHGEITELKSTYMYLDDGTDEVKVYFQRGAGITPKIYQLGDLAQVTGIVGQTKTGYRILPRSQRDIIKTGVVEDIIIDRETAAEESTKEIAEKYLTATAGGLTAILIGLLANMENSPLKKLLVLFRKKNEEED